MCGVLQFHPVFTLYEKFREKYVDHLDRSGKTRCVWSFLLGPLPGPTWTDLDQIVEKWSTLVHVRFALVRVNFATFCMVAAIS